jgi:hypothetical protein
MTVKKAVNLDGTAHVRDLHGVVERGNAAIGVLITVQEPT